LAAGLTGGWGQTDIGNKQAIGGSRRVLPTRSRHIMSGLLIGMQKDEYMIVAQTRTKEEKDPCGTL